MRLYDLLPAIVRAKDGEYGEVLSDLFEAIEGFTDTVSQDIEDLVDLISPSSATLSLLPYLSYLTGHVDDTTLSEIYRRWSLAREVPSNKIKGTPLSWVRKYKRETGDALGIQELYKSEVSEVDDYSTGPDSGHLLPAARVFLGPCETGCETGVEVQTAGGEEALALLESLRPIHVLIPLDVETMEPTDEFPTSLSTLGCFSSCETGEESWTGSVVRGDFSEEFPAGDDELEIKLSCITGCENACTSCCEVSCEQTQCQLKCEISCMVHCTINCEEYCQACNEVECSESCQIYCTQPCEGFCEHSCMNTCQAHECQAHTNQSPITNIACRLGMQNQVDQCEFSCMIMACTLGCTSQAEDPEPPFCQLNACQGACEDFCIFGCTGGCQAGACEAGVSQGMTWTQTGENCNRCRPQYGRITDCGIGEPVELGNGIIFDGSNYNSAIVSQQDSSPWWTSASPPFPTGSYGSPQGRCGTFRDTPNQHYFVGKSGSTMYVWYYDDGSWSQLDTTAGAGFDTNCLFVPSQYTTVKVPTLVPDGEGNCIYIARRNVPTTAWIGQQWDGSSWSVLFQYEYPTDFYGSPLYLYRFHYYYDPVRWCFIVHDGQQAGGSSLLSFYLKNTYYAFDLPADSSPMYPLRKKTPASSFVGGYLRDVWYEDETPVFFLEYYYNASGYGTVYGFVTATLDGAGTAFVPYTPGIHWETPEFYSITGWVNYNYLRFAITLSGNTYVFSGAESPGSGYMHKVIDASTVQYIDPSGYAKVASGTPHGGQVYKRAIHDRYLLFTPIPASGDGAAVYDTQTEAWIDPADFDLYPLYWLGTLYETPGQTTNPTIEQYWDGGSLVAAQKGTHYAMLFYQWEATWEYGEQLPGDVYNKLPYQHARGWKQIPINPPYPQNTPEIPAGGASGFCAFSITREFANGTVMAHCMSWTAANQVTSWVYNGTQWAAAFVWNGVFDNTGLLYNQVFIPVNKFTLRNGEFFLVTDQKIYSYSGGAFGNFSQEFHLTAKDNPGVSEYWEVNIDAVTNEYPSVVKQAAFHSENWSVFASVVKLTQGADFDYYGIRLVMQYNGTWYDQLLDFRYSISGTPVTGAVNPTEIIAISLNKDGHGYLITAVEGSLFVGRILWEIDFVGYLDDGPSGNPIDESHQFINDDTPDAYRFFDTGTSVGPFNVVGAMIGQDVCKDTTSARMATQAYFPNLALAYDSSDIRCMSWHGGFLHVGVSIYASKVDPAQDFGSTSEVFYDVGVARLQILSIGEHYLIDLGGGKFLESGVRWVYEGPPPDQFGYEHYSQYYTQVAKTPATPPGGVSVDKYTEAAGYYGNGTRDQVAPHAMITEEMGDMARGIIYVYYKTGWLMFFPGRGGAGQFMFVKVPYYAESDPYYYRNFLEAWLHPQLTQV